MEFVNSIAQELYKVLGVEVTPYHPHANGLVERQPYDH